MIQQHFKCQRRGKSREKGISETKREKNDELTPRYECVCWEILKSELKKDKIIFKGWKTRWSLRSRLKNTMKDKANTTKKEAVV